MPQLRDKITNDAEKDVRLKMTEWFRNMLFTFESEPLRVCY